MPLTHFVLPFFAPSPELLHPWPIVDSSSVHSIIPSIFHLSSVLQSTPPASNYLPPQPLATQNYDMRPRTPNRQLPDYRRGGHSRLPQLSGPCQGPATHRMCAADVPHPANGTCSGCTLSSRVFKVSWTELRSKASVVRFECSLSDSRVHY